MSVVAIVQARMGSTRLPGKVLRPILDKPMLELQLERIARVPGIGQLVVATTQQPEDNAIAELCQRLSVECFRGSTNDVLDRFYQAAKAYRGNPLLRLTGDCPLVDPQLIQHAIDEFAGQALDHLGLACGVDVAEAENVKRYPDGLDVEVVSFTALERCWTEAHDAEDREHVTSFIWRQPQRFRTASLTADADYGAQRWTVDHEEDFLFVEQVFAALYPASPQFGFRDVLRLVQDRPELVAPSRGAAMYASAKKRIPGGTQLLSKRAEQFLPSGWPTYFRRARGITVEDLDGRVYRDMGIMAVGACPLGYGDPDVDAAVADAVRWGITSSLNAPEELELAQLLCELHPWADQVRYARGGGEAMSVAVRIARAATSKDRVAICGYHGWCDWYLAANLDNQRALDDLLMPGLPPRGVPRALAGTTIPFHYNRADQFAEVLDRYGDELAAVVMEPQRDEPPQPGFLEEIREQTRRRGIVLVFDEITTGFRAACGGLHLKLGVEPDIAVFAKGMANGYAMAAILGRREVMQVAEQCFISSTNWTERIGLAASLATIRKFRRLAVDRELDQRGQRVQQGWQRAAQSNGIELSISGMPCLAEFELAHDPDRRWITAFIRDLLRRGFLAFRQFKPSLAHTNEDIDDYLAACDTAFAAIAQGQLSSVARSVKENEACQAGFYRLT